MLNLFLGSYQFMISFMLSDRSFFSTEYNNNVHEAALLIYVTKLPVICGMRALESIGTAEKMNIVVGSLPATTYSFKRAMSIKDSNSKNGVENKEPSNISTRRRLSVPSAHPTTKQGRSTNQRLLLFETSKRVVVYHIERCPPNEILTFELAV